MPTRTGPPGSRGAGGSKGRRSATSEASRGARRTPSARTHSLDSRSRVATRRDSAKERRTRRRELCLVKGPMVCGATTSGRRAAWAMNFMASMRRSRFLP